MPVVGVDDGALPARRGPDATTLLAAVLIKNAKVRAARLGRISVDGRDANRVLESLLKGLRFEATMLSGISFAGFNLVDIAQLAESTQRPVIAIAGDKPDNAAVRKALQTHFADWQERWRIVRAAGRMHFCKPHLQEPKLYFEVRGLSPAFAQRLIAVTAKISRLPEPIRVARIVARGLTRLMSATIPRS